MYEMLSHPCHRIKLGILAFSHAVGCHIFSDARHYFLMRYLRPGLLITHETRQRIVCPLCLLMYISLWFEFTSGTPPVLFYHCLPRERLDMVACIRCGRSIINYGVNRGRATGAYEGKKEPCRARPGRRSEACNPMGVESAGGVRAAEEREARRPGAPNCGVQPQLLLPSRQSESAPQSAILRRPGATRLRRAAGACLVRECYAMMGVIVLLSPAS
jgi:hypothetical protein